MSSMRSELKFSVQRIASWDVPVIRYRRPCAELSLSVRGTIANSISTTDAGKRCLKEWKANVATVCKASRGETPWSSAWTYAITLGLAFSPALHGWQPLDVENFLKPILDAMAAGLFCQEDQIPSNIERFNYDDSNFRHLLVHRFPDIASATEEVVAIHVSAVE